MIINDVRPEDITTPREVANFIRSLLALEDEISREREHFYVIGLTTSNTVKYVDLVSIGNLNCTLVHPRETYRLAVIKGVAGIICAHNHPSGSKNPSTQDFNITQQLYKAGKILDIQLIDHVIVTKDSYFSFNEENILSKPK